MQVVSYIQFMQVKFPTFGLDLKFGLYRISFYPVFGLESFHCITLFQL